MSHQGLKSLFSQDLRNLLQDEEENTNLKRQIGNEIKAIQKSMNFLPTLREAEALPDLTFVLDLSKTLKEENNFFDLNFKEDPVSRNFIIDQLIIHVCYSVIKTKIYNEKKIIRTADFMFENLVEWATKNLEQENLFQLKMLNDIINSNAEYYKTNGRDQVANKPFGEEFFFQEQQLVWIHELKVGDLLDYSRKTPDGRIIWIPAEVVEVYGNSGRIEIKYLKENQIYFVFNLIGVRKYGEKSESYNWRRELQEKDRVMFFFEDKWSEFEIVTLDGEGMIEISEVVNEKVEDQVIEIDIYSELLARKGEIQEHKSQEDWEDELYLEASEKKKHAILRQINSASSSTFIVKYINIFGEFGGFDFILKIIRKQKMVGAEVLNELLNLLRNSMNNLVKPFIRMHGKVILEFISDQVLNDSIENLRSIDKQNLGNFLEIIQTLGQRIFSQDNARENFFQIELKLSILCLKSNILEKQFFAIKIMSQMEKKCRGIELKNQKQYLGRVFKVEEIFNLIVKGHHSLIAKSQSVMRILFSEDLVSKEELNIFWEQIVKSDQETKNSLLSLLKEVIMDFSQNEVIFFLDKMEEKADSINNLELILLVFKIKKMGQNQFKDDEVVKRTHDVIWSVLQSTQDMKKEFLKEVIFYFIRCVDESNMEEYSKLLIKNILEEKNTLRNLKVLKKLLKQCSEASHKIHELVKASKLASSFIKDIEELIKKKVRLNQERGSQEENCFSETERNMVKKKLNFLKLLQTQIESVTIVTFENFQKIWNSVLRTNFKSPILNEWLRTYILKKKTIEGDKLQQFFYDNVDEFTKIQNSDLLFIIILVFFKVNMENNKILNRELKLETQGYYSYNTKTKQVKLLQVPLAELEGYDKMWNLFLTNKDPDQQKQLCNFITKILEKPDFQDPALDTQLYEKEKFLLFTKLREMTMSEDTEQARKGIYAIQFLMLREEQFGFGELYSFESLQSLPKQPISFEKVNTYMNSDKHTVLLKKNKTLANLRLYISKEYSMSFQSISLSVNGQQEFDYNHTSNSKTLNSLKIKQFNHFNVNEYEVKTSDQPFVMLNSDKTDFNADVIKIFKEIFSNFSDSGKMSKEQMAKFTSKATDGIYCGPNDDRIQHVFREYGGNENHLSFDQFLNFYRDCALTSEYKLETVQNNLISLGYDSSLTLKNFQQSFHFHDQIKGSLRYVLSQDLELHNKIMKQHVEEKFDEQIYQTFKFFTPNFYLMIDFLNNPLKNIKSNELSCKQWNHNIIILETLLFKPKKIQKILNFIDFRIDEEKTVNFHKQVFNQVFFENILRKVDQIKISQISDFQVLYAPYHIINSILVILTDFFVKDYIHDTKNFLIYSMKLKKQKKNTQKLVHPTTPIGPPTQEESAQETSPMPKEETPQKSSEEKCLLDIKGNLEKSNFDFQAYQNSLPYKKLIEVCIQNLQEVLFLKEDDKENIKEFLTFNLITLLSCLNFQKDILKKYLSEKDSKFKLMVFKGLTHQKTVVRILFKNFYLFLTQIIKDEEIKREFLAVIINNIQNSIENDEIYLLIELASNILKEISELKQTQENQNLKRQFDFKKIFGDFTLKLVNYQSKEETFESKEDNTLTAILTFLQKIIQVDQSILKDIDPKQKSDFILFLFKNCLFDVTTTEINFQKVLCKSNGSRTAAKELLAILVKDDPKSIILLYLKGFTPLSHHLPDSQSKQFIESSNKKSNHGFIGIRNPGCICYMNAMIQQFYFIPTFRYGVLLADDNQEENLQEVMQNYQIDDNTFHQFQKLFAYLDLSKRSDFNPRDFCASYKDMTGDRVNVMVQQDSFEFLNVIFDKLEKSLKGSPFQGILDSVFRGKIRTVFECQNCKFSRFKSEVFYNVSLEVKNLENLSESFQKFISKETISDYTCDACKRKCDVTKQTFLQDLPNVLIVHLQKIIFDLELLSNIKLSSKFSFPQVLNLKEFIHEDVVKQMEAEVANLSDDDFQYKLVGVVVHRGNANFGHYTSLINVNRQDPNRPDKNKDEWFEFDDSKINPFNMKNFEEECFGSKMKQDYTANYYGVENNISKSAYILVFDKVKKEKLRLEFNEQNMKEFDKVEKVIEQKQFTFKDNILETDFYSIKPFIPQQYKSVIQNDNIQMILENQLFSSSFTNFLNEVLANSTLPSLTIDSPTPYPELNSYQLSLCDIILQVVPQYFYQIYCSTFFNLSIKKIVGYMETALIYKPDKILQFFEVNVYNQFYEIKNILENNSDYQVHMSLSRFISFTLTLLIRKYNIHEYNQNQSGKSVQQQQIEFKLFNFLDGLKSLSPLEQQEVKINKKMLTYFQILQNICSLNPVVAYYYLNKNYLNKLYDLFMNTDMMTSKNNDKVVNSIISFIETLLQQINRKMIEEAGTDNFFVVRQYFQKFGNINLIKKIMDEDFKFNRYQTLKNLIWLICQYDFSMQKELIRYALKSIKCASDSQCFGYFECLNALIQINDGLRGEKIQMIFGVPKIMELKVEKNNQLIFLYGLSKENSLNRHMFKYPSTLNMEKSLTDMLMTFKENNELQVMYIIYFMILFASQYKEVLRYLIQFPPHNYLSSNLLDWLICYVNYQLKIIPNSYNPPRQDIFYSFIQPLENMVKDLKNLIAQTLIEDHHFSPQLAENFNYFQQPEENKLQISSLNKNFLVGKTIESNLIFKQNILKEEKQQLLLTCHLSKVSLMEYTSDGYTNFRIPKEALSFNMYLNKKELSPQLENFLNTNYNNIIYEDDEDYVQMLKPIGDSDDEQPAEPVKEPKKKEVEVEQIHEVTKEEVDQSEETFEASYVFRIALKNTGDDHYLVELKVEGTEDNHFLGTYSIFVKNSKKDFIVCNLQSRNLNAQFNGLTIKARVHKFSTVLDKYFYPFENEEFEQIYQLNLE